MSIDEAIAKYKEITNTDAICPAHCNISCDKCAERLRQVERMNKAFEKIIEKLEEAKSNVPVNRLLDDIIKDKPKELGQLMAYNKAIEIVKQEAEKYNVMIDGETSCGYSKEDIELNRTAMYNKAIDDFANVLKENYDYLPQILSQESFGLYIDEYAERLI